jgi:hypothetical protein
MYGGLYLEKALDLKEMAEVANNGGAGQDGAPRRRIRQQVQVALPACYHKNYIQF